MNSLQSSLIYPPGSSTENCKHTWIQGAGDHSVRKSCKLLSSSICLAFLPPLMPLLFILPLAFENQDSCMIYSTFKAATPGKHVFFFYLGSSYICVSNRIVFQLYVIFFQVFNFVLFLIPKIEGSGLQVTENGIRVWVGIAYSDLK